MQRPSGIDTKESNQRRAVSDAYNKQQNTSNPDTLADQQLYIRGKMNIEEYQNYLLFKHSTKVNRNEPSTE